MQELHRMFLDFALLTEQQGELLDNIEANVHAAMEYVDEGNVNIEEAIKYRENITYTPTAALVCV